MSNIRTDISPLEEGIDGPGYVADSLLGIRGLVIDSIDAYQQRWSSVLDKRCLYDESCSDFAKRQFGERSLSAAVAISSLRLLSCNPYGDRARQTGEVIKARTAKIVGIGIAVAGLGAAIKDTLREQRQTN